MDASLEHVDVLIVGAGLSGIGAAHHLQDKLPGKTYAILEARGALGGTWDLFRYPGIRSDSDMYTLGYSFKPWESAKAIADGPAILSYVQDAARSGGIEDKIRFNLRAIRAEWSTETATWTVTAARTAANGHGEAYPANTEQAVQIRCSFLFTCTGYYRYDEGYTPLLPGVERFGGQLVHPQHWPHQLDYAGKQVVVIGSGATAVTLVPAMAEQAAHVTMLQRSPSYIISLPQEDVIANALRKLLPSKVAYEISRWKNVLAQVGGYQFSRRRPRLMKAILRKLTERQLPEDVDVDVHFKPTYDPWDQRLCLVPNGDLFRALRHHTASIVTDRIATFTEGGIRLQSGQELPAEIVVTATGLNLIAFGGMQLAIDGRDLALPDTIGYKGMMLSDVPNMAFALGYTNASWTLKCDLTCEYLCRLLKHMDDHHFRQCTPRVNDPEVTPQPFIDFSSGYIQRAIDSFPKQGSKTPWRLHQNYARDVFALRFGAIDDGSIEFAAT